MPEFCTFELDDHPVDWEFTLTALKHFHRRNKRFKANLFCVPFYMSPKLIDECLKHSWIKIFPHGFRHARKECHYLTPDKLRILDELERSPHWGKVFKPPKYGCNTQFLNALNERGFSIAINTLNRMDVLPDMMCWERRAMEEFAVDDRQHVLRHCRYLNPREFGQVIRSGRRSSLGKSWNRRYKRYLWHHRDRDFKFVDELLTPLRVKINIGCGPHHLDGWVNLDHHRHSEDVREWSWPSYIPVVDNRADMVFTSHFLNYVEDFDKFFLEIWRVLRPNGIYRFEEDDQSNGFRWRKRGQRHQTGKIVNEPTKQNVIEALERVGFRVKVMGHNETNCLDRDVLSLHTRHRKFQQGHKFIAEASKSIAIRNLARPYLDDKHSPRRGYRKHGQFPNQTGEGTSGGVRSEP